MTTVTLDKTRPADSFACPDWCVEDHTGDDPTDAFHRSEFVCVELPAGARSGLDGDTRTLMTNLSVHSVDPAQSCISVGDTWDGFDMETPEQVDEYLGHLLDHYLAVRALRGRLAAIQAGA